MFIRSRMSGIGYDFRGNWSESRPWDCTGYSDEIKILEILFLTAGRIKDSQKLSTIRIVCIGKENDIWDSDERSLGCGILVKKGSGIRHQDPFPEAVKPLSSLKCAYQHLIKTFFRGIITDGIENSVTRPSNPTWKKPAEIRAAGGKDVNAGSRQVCSTWQFERSGNRIIGFPQVLGAKAGALKTMEILSKKSVAKEGLILIN